MCIFKEAFMAKQTMIAVAFLAMCGGIQAAAGGEPLQLAMGPDPGGKTGQGVTPESTKKKTPLSRHQLTFWSGLAGKTLSATASATKVPGMARVRAVSKSMQTSSWEEA